MPKQFINTIILFTLLFSNIGFTNALGISQKRINELNILIQNNNDSAIAIINSLEKEANETNNNKSKVDLLILKSNAYRYNQEFEKAYDISTDAHKLAQEISDTLLLIKTNTNLGIMSYVVFKEKESWEHLSIALELTKIMHKREIIHHYALMGRYLNIVQHLKRFQYHHKAFYYLDSCYIVAEKYSLNELNIAYFNVNKGYLLLKINNNKEALEYLGIAEEFFENIDTTKYQQDQRSYLPTVYSHIAEAHRKVGNYELSEEYFIKSLDGLKKYPFHHNHKPYVLEQYAWLLYETGDYEKAMQYLNESKKLSEKYFAAKALNDSSLQEVKNRYQSELNTRMQELIINSMELAQKDKQIMRFRIFTYAILSLILIALLIYKIRRSAKQHEAEKKRIKETEEQARELIKLKNRELTESTLKLIEKEEIIKQLTDKLNVLDSKKNNALIKQINSSSNSMWDDFNNRFKSVNQDFYRKLSGEFPELSSNDLKICALIKLNFSSKEMAQLLGISTDSVQKARYRLRKKLNLERNVNLTSYISSI